MSSQASGIMHLIYKTRVAGSTDSRVTGKQPDLAEIGPGFVDSRYLDPTGQATNKLNSEDRCLQGMHKRTTWSMAW